jgi:hypothetical protein
MDTKFTPGPWFAQRGEIVSANDPICSMPTLYRASKDAKDALAADAALIAAAPEMFEALEEVRMCGNAGAKLSRAASDKVKAALRKARGEA